VAALWYKPMKVVATARKPEEFKDLSATYGDSIPAVKLDVTSPADVEKAVATAVSSEGTCSLSTTIQRYGDVSAKIAVKRLAPTA
jgi:NADP-dependent 3-hydroxy acid dehydrogenase YdfG